MSNTSGQTEANARLIAAAPELYEAAQLALSYMADCLREHPDPETKRRCLLLENAIDKAEGGAE